jgi:hypothetical protein
VPRVAHSVGFLRSLVLPLPYVFMCKSALDRSGLAAGHLGKSALAALVGAIIYFGATRPFLLGVPLTVALIPLSATLVGTVCPAFGWRGFKCAVMIAAMHWAVGGVATLARVFAAGRRGGAVKRLMRGKNVASVGAGRQAASRRELTSSRSAVFKK